MIKGAVFDLDHTLFDRYETLKAVMPEFCRIFKLADDIDVAKATEMMIYADKNYVHFGWGRVLDYLDSQGLFKVKPGIEEYTDGLLSLWLIAAVEFPFTKPMLVTLRERGIKLGIITNGKSEFQRAKLQMLGLTPYVDEIIISGEFGQAKPSAAPYTEMAKRLELEPGEIIYVGDNPDTDIVGARNGGFIPVWVRTTGSWVYPEIEMTELQVDTVAEIPELIENYNK